MWFFRQILALTLLVVAILPLQVQAENIDPRECFAKSKELMFDNPKASLDNLDVVSLIMHGMKKAGRLSDDEMKTGTEILIRILTDKRNGHIKRGSFVRVLYIPEPEKDRHQVVGTLTIEGGVAPGEYGFVVLMRFHICKVFEITVGGQLFSLRREILLAFIERKGDKGD